MLAHHNCHIAGGPIRTKKPLLQSRVELYLQFEGCIRHTTLWEFMKIKKISLPDTVETRDYNVPQLQDVISFMVSRSEGSNGLIGRKLQLCLEVLSDDPEAVERVCNEFSEDVLREVHYEAHTTDYLKHTSAYPKFHKLPVIAKTPAGFIQSFLY